MTEQQNTRKVTNDHSKGKKFKRKEENIRQVWEIGKKIPNKSKDLHIPKSTDILWQVRIKLYVC